MNVKQRALYALRRCRKEAWLESDDFLNETKECFAQLAAELKACRADWPDATEAFVPAPAPAEETSGQGQPGSSPRSVSHCPNSPCCIRGP